MSNKKTINGVISKKENLFRNFTLVCACALLYTYVRYIVFGNVAYEQLPVFLLNKALSMCSVLCLFVTSIYYMQGQHMIKKIKFWGKAALQTAYLHIALSLTIVSKSYYPKFFGDLKMNATGEVIILVGLIAAYCFWLLDNPKKSIVKIHTLQILASIFIIIHLVVMGYSGWLTVYKWNGGLPPISLVSVTFAIMSLLLFTISKKKVFLNEEPTLNSSY